MRALTILGLGLAPLFTASAASAGHNEITLGSSTRALRSSSADAVTGDSLVGGALTLGRALPVELPIHDLTLWAQASLDWGDATGSMFQTLGTELGGTLLTGGARLRYTPFSHVAASAKLAVGSERASLRLTDPSGHTASDHGWGGAARGALEVDVLAIDLPGFALGLRFELGYLKATGIELVPQRAQDDTLKIPMTEASLGHLDLSGPYVDFGVLAQF